MSNQMKQAIIYLAILVPACVSSLACTGALKNIEAVTATAVAECTAAKTEYEAAKAEYIAIRQSVDDACKVVAFLPEAIEGVDLTKLKAGCAGVSKLDSLAKRIDTSAQRVGRVCSAVEELTKNAL